MFLSFKGPVVGALAMLVLVGASCTWMSSDTASAFARADVMTREEAKSFLVTAIVQRYQSCSTLVRPGLMMINEGFPHALGRPFYYKDGVDLCFVAILTSPCPAGELSDTDAVSYFRWVLKMCNPRPFEL